MDKIKFIDDFFKSLFLIFWVIVWYSYLSISKTHIGIAMSLLFTISSIFYMMLIITNKNKFEKITILYRVSNLFTFLLFLYSYSLFSKNIILLFLEILFILLNLYISYIKNSKYKMNEGVVGILSSLLLLTLTVSHS